MTARVQQKHEKLLCFYLCDSGYDKCGKICLYCDLCGSVPEKHGEINKTNDRNFDLVFCLIIVGCESAKNTAIDVFLAWIIGIPK